MQQHVSSSSSATGPRIQSAPILKVCALTEREIAYVEATVTHRADWNHGPVAEDDEDLCVSIAGNQDRLASASQIKGRL